MAGWLCVPLVGWMLRRAGATLGTARLGSALTAVSVFFIITARQARYYPLAAAATLLVVGTYASLIDRRRDGGAIPPRHQIAFGLSACLLVASFDVTSIGVLGAIAFHWLFIEHRPLRNGRCWDRRFWMPWATARLRPHCLGGTFDDRSVLGEKSGRCWPAFRPSRAYYAGQFNGHVMPIPLFLGLGLLLRTPPGGTSREHERTRQMSVLLGIVALGGIAGGMLAPMRFYRYIVPSVPLVISLAAVSLTIMGQWGRTGRGLAVVLVVALTTSSALFVWSHSVMASLVEATGLVNVTERSHDHGMHLAQLVRELRDPPRGPIAATVEFLRERAETGRHCRHELWRASAQVSHRPQGLWRRDPRAAGTNGPSRLVVAS